MKRRLVDLWLSMALALGALLLLAASVQAASRPAPQAGPRAQPAGPAAVTFTVTTSLDAPDDNLADHLCHETADGQCSLRAAAQQLNHDNGGTILLGGGVYTLTDDADGDLQLQKNINIQAPFYFFNPFLTEIIGPPGWTHRIFRVQNNAHVELENMDIAGGNVTGDGGGLDVVSGTVDLFVVYFFNNHSTSGGGGIYNGGRLNLDFVALDENTSAADGAGLFNAAAAGPGPNLTMTDSSLGDNLAGSIGGGLYNLGQANVFSSTLVGNTAEQGGGAANFSGGSLTIQASTIYSNAAATGAGGGLYNVDAPSVLELVNSTVASNAAATIGGGLVNFSGQVYLSNVTVAANAAHPVAGSGGGGLYSDVSTFYLANTLVGDNHDVLNLAPDCAGTFDSHGYNLVQSVAGCTLTDLTTGDVTGQDPLLLPLGYIGGPTPTMGLGLHSPAIDAGNPLGCKAGLLVLSNDQRGRPRSVDGNGDGVARCDIGAYELQLRRVFLPLTRR